MEILEATGIGFHHPEAVDIFKHHGFKTRDDRVFITEAQVQAALETSPASFSIRARNPENDITIGLGPMVITPGFGAAFIAEDTGEQRPGTLADYEIFTRLVQTSESIDMNGCLMVQPSDLPAETMALKTQFSSMTLCDKTQMTSAATGEEALQCLGLLRVLWGDEMDRDYVTLSSGISPLSPLQYSHEMAGGVIAFARANQPLEFGACLMAGSTGPITLAGTLVQQNAELLSGIVLAQLIQPGLGCIYGGTSSVVDMRTGFFSCGAPEFALLQWGSVQLSKLYGLPARCTGGLTDSNLLDIQAGVETCQDLFAAFISGADFMRHSCGILSSYMAMNYTKFLVDEDICTRMKYMAKGIPVSKEDILAGVISEVGDSSGNYLMHPETMKRCRSTFNPPGFFPRNSLVSWEAQGAPTIGDLGKKILDERLAGFQEPDLDPAIRKDLETFITKYE